MKILMTTFILLFSSLSFSFDHEHSALTKLLKAHVKMSTNNTSSSVDYKNFNKTELNKYLKTVSAVTTIDFKKFTKKQQLAFYINTYNAYTIKLILNHYPVTSIKKTVSFFSNPWKKDFFKLFGKNMHLDKIEHSFVRGNKTLGKDARIHFAFNCASIGCPALLNEAWTATKMEQQLNAAAQNFLKDHSRNRINISKKRVELSNVFKWYNEDFTNKNYKSLKGFLSTYLDSIASTEKEKTLIKSKKYSIHYSGYDWALNKTNSKQQSKYLLQ